MPRRVVYPVPYAVRVTERMAEGIERLARQSDMSGTEWIRERVRLALAADAKKRRRARQAAPPVYDVDAEDADTSAMLDEAGDAAIAAADARRDA